MRDRDDRRHEHYAAARLRQQTTHGAAVVVVSLVLSRVAGDAHVALIRGGRYARSIGCGRGAAASLACNVPALEPRHRELREQRTACQRLPADGEHARHT
jgi:hypothetical protein